MFAYDSPCQISACSAIARGEDSFCNICRRYLCRSHFDSKRHICRYQGRPEWFQEKWQTLAELDVDKLKQEIATLRPGSPFVVDVSVGDVSDRTDDGGINLHVPIKFESGEEWLLRIPSFSDKPEPAPITAQVHLSEVLTYKALKAAGVAVPEVYGWGMGTVSKTADACFTHMVYEKLPGSPVHDLNTLSPEQLALFIDTYAAQAIQVSEVKFAAIGGLCTNDANEIVVGKSVDIRNSNGPHCKDLGGPFHSSLEYYLHHIEAVLSAIKANMLFREAPLLAYLANLEVRELIRACPTLKEEEHEFYLKHPDGKSDNQLITSTGKVSALLDWQWAETTCKTAAFGAPKWAYGQGFWNGNMALAELEVRLCEAYERRGRDDLAHCVRNARVHQLLDGYLGSDLYSSDSGFGDCFLGYFQAIQRTLDPSCAPDSSTSISQWVSQMEQKYEGDQDLTMVKELDRQSWKNRRPSKVIYPLKQFFGRAWTRCLEAIGRR